MLFDSIIDDINPDKSRDIIMCDNCLSDAGLIAYSYVGSKYVFGGKNPLTGIDCSGMVELVLWKLGVMPRGYHRSSQMIFDYVTKNKNFFSVGKPTKDCLLFYRNKDTGIINHIALALNERVMIEASGLNDMVEVNMISRLPGLAECIKILY